MYDIIGDIHGHAGELKVLLQKMDYKETGGVWQHASRKAIFVGDYIDRGPQIRETLHIIRSMVEGGHAVALMGNHEYNALAYHYALPDGSFLRAHNEKHLKQHRETIRQFEDHQDEWRDYLEWFYTLPLFVERDGLRAVHACWDEAHMAWLRDRGYERLNEALLVASHQRGSKEYIVIEDILKGKEMAIPEEYTWLDKDGNPRKKNRIKWWVVPGRETSHEEFLFNCPEALRTQKIGAVKVNVYPKEAPPVFFGHYWLQDAVPAIQSHNVICLDYSVARGGALVAYRWKGEATVDSAHLVRVPCAEKMG